MSDSPINNQLNLPHVAKGQAITAEAWNNLVDKANGAPNVSIVRRRKNTGGEEQMVCTRVEVVDDSLRLYFDPVKVVKKAPSDE